MGLSKKEVNLRRLLAAAPHQQNQAKLVHYVTTSRELLEQIGAEAATGGISSISKAKLNEYSEKIEAIAARLSVPEVRLNPWSIPILKPESEEAVQETSFEEIVPVSDNTESSVYPAHILRRRTSSATKVDDINHELAARDIGAPLKLDAEAQAHIEKHRKLQDDLTDEMVTLAQQLKESTLMMNKSLNETEMGFGVIIDANFGVPEKVAGMVENHPYSDYLDDAGYTIFLTANPSRIIRETYGSIKQSMSANYYPERLGKVFLIHVPSLFMRAWKIVYPYIDKNTRNKFIFVEDKNLRASLLEDIDEDHLSEIYELFIYIFDVIEILKCYMSIPKRLTLTLNLYGRELY
ncbi:hypothetical protein M5K25_000238, partial [Dendrobium thyrsiflorum]